MSVALCVMFSEIFSLTAFADSSDSKKNKVDPEARTHYQSLSQFISPGRLSQTVQTLSGIHYPLPA